MEEFMLSSTRTVFDAITHPFKLAYHGYHAGIRYIFDPVKVISLGVLFSLSRSNAEKLCKSVQPKFDFPGSMRVSHFFDVYANVEQLSQAEYILIGVQNYTASIYEAQNRLINSLGDRNTAVYFSGVSGFFRCKSFCLRPNLVAEISDDTDGCLPLLSINYQFTCIGWEHEQFILAKIQNDYLTQRREKFRSLASKTKVYVDLYVPLEKRLSDVQVQYAILDTGVTFQANDNSVKGRWFAGMHELISLVELIYRDCISDKYPDMSVKLEEIRSLIPNSTTPITASMEAHEIARQMNDILPEMKLALSDLGDQMIEFNAFYQQQYVHNLTDSTRVKEGLVSKINLSKDLPGKKFFIAPRSIFLKPSSSAFFPPCNMSDLRQDVYDSLQHSPFAVLNFKP
jgi:hypothetical protein